jgi:hypothetical protein
MSDTEPLLIPNPSPQERPSSPTLLPSERGEGSSTWLREKAPLLSPAGEGVGVRES